MTLLVQYLCCDKEFRNLFLYYLNCSFDTEREANTSIFSDDEEDFLEDTSSDENLRYVQFQNLSGLCSNSMFNNWNDSTFL